MKLLLQILIVMVFAFLLEIFLPWWAVAIAGAAAGMLIGGGAGRAFIAGFLGVGILWLFAAQSMMNAHDTILADRIGAMLPGSPPGKVVAIIAGVVGGLVAGMGAATGARLRASLRRTEA
jgi:hypothetical protein